MMPDMVALVNKYRDSVEIRVYWQDHGTYADNHLPEAKALEIEAKRNLLHAISKGAK